MKYLLEDAQTSRLLFRKINASDFESWLVFFKDPSSFEHWKSEFQTPETECKKRQAERYSKNEGGMNALIEKSSGKLAGYCGLLLQTVDGVRELEVGYSLLADFRNQGLALEAARKCRDYAFESDFSDSLISIISLTNPPSATVAVKNGMQVDRQTIYKENKVNIFRIIKADWLNLVN